MILTLTSFLSANVVVMAQDTPPPPMPPPPPGLPIDGPVLFLLVIGLVYGAFKMNQLKRPKTRV